MPWQILMLHMVLQRVLYKSRQSDLYISKPTIAKTPISVYLLLLRVWIIYVHIEPHNRYEPSLILFPAQHLNILHRNEIRLFSYEANSRVVIDFFVSSRLRRGLSEGIFFSLALRGSSRTRVRCRLLIVVRSQRLMASMSSGSTWQSLYSDPAVVDTSSASSPDE